VKGGQAWRRHTASRLRIWRVAAGVAKAAAAWWLVVAPGERLRRRLFCWRAGWRTSVLWWSVCSTGLLTYFGRPVTAGLRALAAGFYFANFELWYWLGGTGFALDY